jgi:FlaA1/EpsC-like NDP-sugar epimerase
MGSRLIDRHFLSILLADAVAVVGALYLAYLLRFNFEVPAGSMAALKRMASFLLPIHLVVFYLFDLYRGMWRYTSLSDLLNVIKAVSVSVTVVLLLLLFTRRLEGIPRSVFIIDWMLSIVFVAGLRLAIRWYFRMTSGGLEGERGLRQVIGRLGRGQRAAKRLLVIGAGDCGEMIYREIRTDGALRYRVVGFVDDDPRKVGMKIHGVPVAGSVKDLKALKKAFKVDEALIAIPSAGAGEMRTIVAACKEAGIPFKTVPSLGELINGRVTLKAVRDVKYSDLLGREPVHLDQMQIGAYLEGRRVLVTGAGGSIGSELCRQICRFRPSALILLERAESPLYEIDLELRGTFPDLRINPVLGDIRDRSQLAQAFHANRPEVVFHAAAYKHVPMMEAQPWKAVRNNILGTRNVVETAVAFSVDRFVFVSTDKAVRPASVMGATKRVAELIVQGQNGHRAAPTRFMIVRFGNVVGSAGSVVPLFKTQIERGGPVTVTHPEVTRYFMTIPEACQLIVQAGAMGRGGEIFVLDMGVPVKIADLARDLIRLSGFEPDQDIRIQYIGLRPGEKLHEELILEGEGVAPTAHEKILVLRGSGCDQHVLNGKIDALAVLARGQDGEGIKGKLREILPEYRPARSLEV